MALANLNLTLTLDTDTELETRTTAPKRDVTRPVPESAATAAAAMLYMLLPMLLWEQWIQRRRRGKALAVSLAILVSWLMATRSSLYVLHVGVARHSCNSDLRNVFRCMWPDLG